MAKLAKAVFVRDPDRHRTVLLNAGEEPEPRLAALVTNPDAWEDGKLPQAAKETQANAADSDSDGSKGEDSSDDSGDAKKAEQPAKKTAARKTAATSRSRGRDAADEGTSGE